MRLTLRTLLAWLDDTLTPAEVRAIGKQVAELDYAKELVERIHKVTRQRRLTIPPRTGPDSVDANVVASYLDSELDPDLVSEFEKKCLTSDVHLAEVASVHQILSLIGQKAKVPPEAKERMYQLIKGRESTRPSRQAPPSRKVAEPDSRVEPIKPWVMPAPPKRKGKDQIAPILALAALIAILCWSAWVSLTPVNDAAPLIVTPRPPVKIAPPERPEPPKQDAPVALANAVMPKAETPKPDVAKKEAAKPLPAAVAEKPARTFAEGVVAEAAKPTGLLARFNTEKSEWTRLSDDTPLRDGDRLLSLEPFRATLAAPGANLFLIGETEVVGREAPATLGAKLELVHGKIVVEPSSSTLPIEILCNGATITIEAAVGQKIGVERRTRREQGSATFVPPVLRFWVADGTVKLKAAEGAEVTLEGPGSIDFESPSTWWEKSALPAPGWVAMTPNEPEQEKAGEAFLEVFQPERTLIWSLVEALEVKDPAITGLAIPALRALGDLEYIVPLLNRAGGANSAVARKTAIATLRQAIVESPESANRVHDQLVNDLGVDIAKSVEQLLIGFPPDTANSLDIVGRLVKVLETKDESDVGLRQLSLDNLMTLSGLGDLGYDPEKPSGDGLKGWKKFEAELRAKANSEAGSTQKQGTR